MTGTQHVERALQEIGFLGAGQAASAEDASFALTVSQRMFNAWAAERLTIVSILRTTKTLTSGTRDYTIGSGGSINIVRPLWIDHAAIILDNTATTVQELPIRLYTDDEWALVGQKTLASATLEGIYFDRAFNSSGLGTISTYPTINIAIASLALYTPKATVGYTALTDDVTFAPGYEEAVHYQLARRLCRPYGRPLTPDLIEDADESLRRIKFANVELSPVPVATPWTTGLYDINSDTTR